MRAIRFRVIPVLLALGLTVPLAAADFTAEPAGAPPSEGVPEGVLTMLQGDGVRVKGPDGKVMAEYWGRATPFSGDPASGFGIRFDNIPAGALLGLVRFPDSGSDFREQGIPTGVYTMRYTLHPEDGNHMGVAPSRDFAVLIPAAEDQEPEKNYAFEPLAELAKKVGNAHPTVLRVQLPEGDESAHLWENDYGHWVLDLKIVDDTVGIVVYGHSEE